MPLQVQEFTGITPGKLGVLLAKIKEDTGIVIEPSLTETSHGEAGERGFVFFWTYDPAALKLTIQVLKKPFFVLSHTILNAISEEVAGIKEPPPAPAPAPETSAPEVSTSAPEVK